MPHTPPRIFRLWRSFRKLVSFYPRSTPGAYRCLKFKTVQSSKCNLREWRASRCNWLRFLSVHSSRKVVASENHWELMDTFSDHHPLPQ